MTRGIRVAIAVITLTGCAACGGSVAVPTPVANGDWGGDRIAMAVASAATHIELDCAHGDAGLLVQAPRLRATSARDLNQNPEAFAVVVNARQVRCLTGDVAGIRIADGKHRAGRPGVLP